MTGTPLAFSTFHLTGEKSGDDFVDPGKGGLRPALFSAYGDLSRLRYDFPLVLVLGRNGGGFLHSLTDIVNDLLTEIAPRGIDGERLRKHVLGLEDEIRALAQDGHKGALSEIRELACSNLLARAGDADGNGLAESLALAGDALTVEGEIVGFDEHAPAKVLTHGWAVVRERKARRFLDEVGEMTLRLSDILKADERKSEASFDAEHLKGSVGSSYESAFDFDAMSDILAPAFVDGVLPDKRRQRIRSVLSTLESQKFFPADGGGAKKGRRGSPRAYVFERCQAALEAFHNRLPEMVEFVKATTIARLEIEGRYRDAAHDPFFRRFDERFVEADDLAAFPPHLVCFRNGRDAAAEKGEIAEILSSGLPIKILVQSDDILAPPSIAAGRLAFGAEGSALAAMALGLDGVFVLQTSGAGLYRLGDAIVSGLEHRGPALFNIFSGRGAVASTSSRNMPGGPHYLRAAAATESRAFPTFVRDPGQGGDWASRFSLTGNPQVDSDWPRHTVRYEDKDLQRLSDDVAFTFVDFAATDERYVDRFACVPSAKWDDSMVPMHEFLSLDADVAADKVPYILAIDENDVLYRAIVETGLIQAARRCLGMWRSLQELAGFDNSHARALVAHEREVWEQEKENELAALKEEAEQKAKAAVAAAPEPAPAPALAAPAGAAAPEPAESPGPEAAPEAASKAAPEPAQEPGEPYIETPRCTTCDECTQINNRMFAYDDNKQAYVADPDAGTYRQLVEAAESCQVAIIHPGKPRNPDEPNLEDLIARAEPFN